MKKLFLLLLTFYSIASTAQVISLTPQANTYQIITNTTFGPGTPGTKTFIVCPGVTLNYSESSTMDTIILRSGSTLKIDSIFSYGYARIYAQTGSTVDMNFRQTGSLSYEAGVTILDTNIGPPSFFQGAQQVTTVQISYANILGGVSACSPTNVGDIDKDNKSVNVHVAGNTLHIRSSNSIEKSYSIINTQGQVVKEIRSTLDILHEDISLLSKGIYWLKWKSISNQGVVAFTK